ALRVRGIAPAASSGGASPRRSLSPRVRAIRARVRRLEPHHSEPHPRRIPMNRWSSRLLAGLLSLAFASVASAEGTLRIGMTASDIPYTGGQTDQGFEGFRFVGYQVYEPMINWDLSKSDRLPALVPGLAESWSVSKEDSKKWIFKLRKNVK